MIDAKLQVKVADFGLTRKFLEEKVYYKQENRNIPLPFRWLAIESLKDGRYTTKSDVWSFGVVMWELFTRAKKPYEGIGNNTILSYLESGNRLPRPLDVHELIFNITLQCWVREPNERPSFQNLATELKNVLTLFDKKQASAINQDLVQEAQQFDEIPRNFCEPNMNEYLYSDYQRMYQSMYNENIPESEPPLTPINSGPIFKNGFEEMDSINVEVEQSIEPPTYNDATASDFLYEIPTTSGIGKKSQQLNGNSTTGIMSIKNSHNVTQV